MCKLWKRFIFSLFITSMVLALTITAYASQAEYGSIASSSDASSAGQDMLHHTGSGITDNKQERIDIEEASPSDLMINDITPFSDEPLYKFSIRKVGADGMLDGAVFRLYHHLDDANEDRNPIYFILDDEEPPLYTACPSSGCAALSNATKDITAGIAFMEGLPVGTYYLAEIAAPEGYQKLHYPYEIELKETGSVYYAQVMSGDNMTSAPGGQILIGNYAMVLMPGTGGAGKYLLYVLGTGCILAALFMGFRLKKRGDG